MDTKIIELRQAANSLPANLVISQLAAKSEVLRLSELIDAELAQLRTAAAERDEARILSGVIDGVTLSEWIYEELELSLNARIERDKLKDQLQAANERADLMSSTAHTNAERARNLIIRIWEMADNGTSTFEIDPGSPLWQIEADTRTWLAANASAPQEERTE